MSETTHALTRRSLLAGACALAAPKLIGRAEAAGAVDLTAAKRQGKVVLYTSAPLSSARKAVNAFQQKYGITVELFRTGGGRCCAVS